MKNRPRTVLLLNVLLLNVVSITSASAALSFFTSPGQNLNLNSQPLGHTGSASTSVTLGEASTTRVLEGTVTATASPVGITVALSDNLLDINEGNGDGATFTVGWGSTGDLNLDLTSYGNGFSYTHIYSDPTPGSQIQITVWNGTTSFTGPLTTLARSGFNPSDPADIYTIPFTSFSGADFTNIDRISFKVYGQPGADLQISNFQVVPEPSGILLTGVAGVLALFQRKRKA